MPSTMKFLIRYVALSVSFSFLLLASSKAAVLKASQPLSFYEWTIGQSEMFPEHAFSNDPIQNDRPGKHKNPDDLYNSTIEGRIAFVCSLFSIASLIAFSLTSFPFFLVPVVAFAVLAMAFGTVGYRRRQRGFAIAGFSLGFIFMVWGFALIAAL